MLYFLSISVSFATLSKSFDVLKQIASSSKSKPRGQRWEYRRKCYDIRNKVLKWSEEKWQLCFSSSLCYMSCWTAGRSLGLGQRRVKFDCLLVCLTFRLLNMFLSRSVLRLETKQWNQCVYAESSSLLCCSFLEGCDMKRLWLGPHGSCWTVFLWMEAELQFWLLVLRNCLGDQLSHSLAERMTHTSSALFGSRSLLQWIELVLIKY